jgi:hypothetical protein
MRGPVVLLVLAACAAEPDELATRDLTLTPERALLWRMPDGGQRVIARDVADPRIAPDGKRVVFTQLPTGRSDIAPDTTGHLVLVDLERGTRRTISRHPLDSSPFVVPGSDDVLFVSGRTGVASLFLARPGEPVRQLTNVGMKHLDPARFVPVPGRDLEFQPGTRVAVYTARYGGVASRWSVDVDTGEARRL